MERYVWYHSYLNNVMDGRFWPLFGYYFSPHKLSGLGSVRYFGFDKKYGYLLRDGVVAGGNSSQTHTPWELSNEWLCSVCMNGCEEFLVNLGIRVSQLEPLSRYLSGWEVGCLSWDLFCRKYNKSKPVSVFSKTTGRLFGVGFSGWYLTFHRLLWLDSFRYINNIRADGLVVLGQFN